MCMCINAGMAGFPISDQSRNKKKLMMPGPIRYRTKQTGSGIFLVRYRIEIVDAKMTISSLVSSMLMPSNG